MIASRATSRDEVEWYRGGPLWLRGWLGDQPFAAGDRVIGLYVSERGFIHLRQLRSLKAIRLSGLTVSNQQIDSLRDLPNLEALDMGQVMVGHEELDEKNQIIEAQDGGGSFILLPPMPRLRGLNLYETNFRGDGLERLASIEVLDLSLTDVGDEAMPKFKAMRNLKESFADRNEDNRRRAGTPQGAQAVARTMG